MTRPLEGVRVLEVAAWTFVPAAGAALADLGADVIKVEPPNGDPQRGLMNLLGSAERPGPNPFVEIPNRGKRGMTIDLATGAGRDVLLEVAATADVFLTSYLPAVRKKLGIELEDLRAANPQIIYVCGHGWGARGPMKDTGGFDLAAGWASAGMAAKMTRPGEEPMFQPAAFFDLQGANTIAGAIGTALFQRERSGAPTEVDVSLLGVGMWTLSPDIMAGPYVGNMPAPDRTKSPNPLTNSYPTSDGRWLYLVCLQADRFWAELCETIGRSELIADERFSDMVVRAQNAEACVAELESTFVSGATRALAQADGRFHRRLGSGPHPGRGARARPGRRQRVPARGGRTRRLHLPASRAADAVRRRPTGTGGTCTRARAAHRGNSPRTGARLGCHRRAARVRRAWLRTATTMEQRMETTR